MRGWCDRRPAVARSSCVRARRAWSRPEGTWARFSKRVAPRNFYLCRKPRRRYKGAPGADRVLRDRLHVIQGEIARTLEAGGLVPAGDDPSRHRERARHQSFTPLAAVEAFHDGVDEIPVGSDLSEPALRERDGEL